MFCRGNACTIISSKLVQYIIYKTTFDEIEFRNNISNLSIPRGFHYIENFINLLEVFIFIFLLELRFRDVEIVEYNNLCDFKDYNINITSFLLVKK